MASVYDGRQSLSLFLWCFIKMFLQFAFTCGDIIDTSISLCDDLPLSLIEFGLTIQLTSWHWRFGGTILLDSWFPFNIDASWLEVRVSILSFFFGHTLNIWNKFQVQICTKYIISSTLFTWRIHHSDHYLQLYILYHLSVYHFLLNLHQILDHYMMVVGQDKLGFYPNHLHLAIWCYRGRLLSLLSSSKKKKKDLAGDLLSFHFHRKLEALNENIKIICIVRGYYIIFDPNLKSWFYLERFECHELIKVIVSYKMPSSLIYTHLFLNVMFCIFKHNYLWMTTINEGNIYFKVLNNYDFWILSVARLIITCFENILKELYWKIFWKE